MPAELPYLPSYKNVALLFEKIAAAKLPDSFTQKYLYETIGIKGANDRPLIPLLKALGFLDGSGKPTTEYGRLKNPTEAPFAIGDAVRRAYEPLFSADEKANELPPDSLKGLIAQVAGTDFEMTKKIAGTFNALLKVSKFRDAGAGSEEVARVPELPPEATGAQAQPSLKPQFHYNIQIHLPSNGSEETYLNIFNALRKVFQ